MSQYVDTLLVKKHIEWEKFDKENPESRELIDHALINFQNSVEAFLSKKDYCKTLLLFVLPLSVLCLSSGGIWPSLFFP